MSDTKLYKVTNPATHWISGRRVAADGTISLSDAQAAHDLARANIALAEPEKTNTRKATAPAPQE